MTPISFPTLVWPLKDSWSSDHFPLHCNHRWSSWVRVRYIFRLSNLAGKCAKPSDRKRCAWTVTNTKYFLVDHIIGAVDRINPVDCGGCYRGWQSMHLGLCVRLSHAPAHLCIELCWPRPRALASLAYCGSFLAISYGLLTWVSLQRAESRYFFQYLIKDMDLYIYFFLVP